MRSGSESQIVLTGCLAMFLAATPCAGQEEAEEYHGRLEDGDKVYDGGHFFYDVYDFDGAADEIVSIDVLSEDFDTWIAVKCADDPEFSATGDDWEQSAKHAHLLLTLPLAGNYQVHVSANDERAEGEYDLRIVRGAAALESVRSADRQLDLRSKLQSTDGTLPSGEYYDLYQIDGLPGQQVVARVDSEEFDPYVYLRSPCDAAMTVGNEDFEGSDSVAQFEATVTVASTLNVYVTSDVKGETGAYELAISVWNLAEREAGLLTQSDDDVDEKRYDRFVYHWQHGQKVAVALTSEDFTPQLRIIPVEPSRQETFVDSGHENRARVEFEAPIDGDYFVFVTSVEDDGRGAYEVELRTHSQSP